MKAWGYTQYLQDELENKAGQSRSIYRSRGRTPMRDDDRHTGYTKYKSGWAKYNRPDSFELHHDVVRHRDAAHPLCFTDEVMEHPEGFKPVNIEP